MKKVIFNIEGIEIGVEARIPKGRNWIDIGMRTLIINNAISDINTKLGIDIRKTTDDPYEKTILIETE